MLTIYKNTDAGLAVIDDVVPGSWVHVVSPDADTVARLRDELGVPAAFIAASLDTDELARTDREGQASLITLLVPHVYTHDPSDIPFTTTPLGIVLTDGLFVTISRERIGLIDEFTRRYGRSISTAKRNRMILQLLLSTAQHYLIYLRQIEGRVDGIQKKAQVSLKNKELLDLLRYQKSLTYFRTSLESNGLMMRRLQRSRIFEMYPDDQELLDDVLTENTQATEMTKISSDILIQMMAAYASIISNNLNDVMKILAVATIILSIPTVIASIYGMNVPLPGQNLPWSFATIIGLALVLAATVALIFRRQRWL